MLQLHWAVNQVAQAPDTCHLCQNLIRSPCATFASTFVNDASIPSSYTFVIWKPGTDVTHCSDIHSFQIYAYLFVVRFSHVLLWMKCLVLCEYIITVELCSCNLQTQVVRSAHDLVNCFAKYCCRLDGLELSTGQSLRPGCQQQQLEATT